MAKAQIISMDFIMAFVIFMVALSVFFFSFQSNLKKAAFQVDPKLIFDKLINMKDPFIHGAKIDGLDEYMLDYDPKALHDILRDTSESNFCIFIHNGTQVLRHFPAYANENNIYFGTKACGNDKFTPFFGTPSCKGKDALLLTKPVIYGTEVMSLNIYACSP
jgi:hypothetical protein